MKRKNIFRTLLLLSLLLLVTACASQDNNSQGNTSAQNKTSQNTVNSNHSNATSSDKSPQTQSQQTTTETPSTAISEEDAKSIALDHAGFIADRVTFIRSTLDTDDRRIHYDVEFYAPNNMEYDYEIAYDTGEILEWDAEPIDD